MKRQAMIGSRRPERRAEIVSAAGRIIEQKGLEGASLRAIARELGCTTGVLTHHFVSKEDLLHAALDALFRPFAKRYQAAFNQRMPNEAQASTYSAVRHYLKAVAAAATTRSHRSDFIPGVACGAT